jgi:hypothetical protein
MGEGRGVFTPILLPFLNWSTSSLNRGRERAFILFLRLFLVCFLFSFFLLARGI